MLLSANQSTHSTLNIYIDQGCDSNLSLEYMDTVVSKAMIAAACDLIIDAYRMDVPAMEATDIPTIGDMINKQKWILEAKSVEKMIEVEKDILDIKNCDNLEWLQPTGCDTLLEDMPLPLPLRDSLYAFPMNALTDLLVPQAVSILPQQPRDSLGDLMSVWFEVDKALVSY
jgi:hypothetical protein